MYLTFSEFIKLFPNSEIKEPEFSALVTKAEADINSLTFNRITVQGYNTLTGFQRGLVSQATAEQVMFINENCELIESPLSSYSIGGVSMSFDKSKVVEVGSVVTSKKVYGLLMQTGFCYRGI